MHINVQELPYLISVMLGHGLFKTFSAKIFVNFFKLNLHSNSNKSACLVSSTSFTCTKCILQFSNIFRQTTLAIIRESA